MFILQKCSFFTLTGYKSKFKHHYLDELSTKLQ